jgi:pimeloyl-ACP methyl ester carboxylesterase
MSVPKPTCNLLHCIAVVLVACMLFGCTTTPTAKQSICPHSSEAAPAVSSDSRLVFPERLDQGYTIVLPGIWGEQPVDYGIVNGLQDGDIPSAIEMYDWTAGAFWLVYNLRAIEHNRSEARKIAAKIVAYQDRFPGRPVHLVGYSGGAGMAVLTLEALPADRKVTSAILLAPSLASNYDLRPALSHTSGFLSNFYSPLDLPILMVLTTAFGTTEGEHTIAAGAIGFQAPGKPGSQQRRFFESHVRQQSYNLGMLTNGHCGGHFGWTGRAFIAQHVAPLLAVPDASEPPAQIVSTN